MAFDAFRPDDAGDESATLNPKAFEKRPRRIRRVIAGLIGLLLLAAAVVVAVIVS